MKQPTVNRLVQNAKKEVGKNSFENIEEHFRLHAEKEMLRIRLQELINQLWRIGSKTAFKINARRGERWLKQMIKENVNE